MVVTDIEGYSGGLPAAAVRLLLLRHMCRASSIDSMICLPLFLSSWSQQEEDY